MTDERHPCPNCECDCDTLAWDMAEERIAKHRRFLSDLRVGLGVAVSRIATGYDEAAEKQLRRTRTLINRHLERTK